jgi:hypothetical protein
MISIGDIERVFNDGTVEELAKIAQLPPDADLSRFKANLRLDAGLFIQSKARMSMPRLREAIQRLYSLNRRAERGGDRAARLLARAVGVASPEVWRWLSRGGPHAQTIPTAAEILAQETRQIAVERLRLIFTFGGCRGFGRKRPSGSRSRSFRPLLRIPGIDQRAKDKLGRPIGRRGRPRGEAEREFLQNLALSYLEATGSPPPDTANYNIVIRGPFSKFVHRCFELVGAPAGGVTRLINEFGSIRRQARSGITQLKP